MEEINRVSTRLIPGLSFWMSRAFSEQRALGRTPRGVDTPGEGAGVDGVDELNRVSTSSSRDCRFGCRAPFSSSAPWVDPPEGR